MAVRFQTLPKTDHGASFFLRLLQVPLVELDTSLQTRLILVVYVAKPFVCGHNLPYKSFRNSSWLWPRPLP